jgi:hypothetical protein
MPPAEVPALPASYAMSGDPTADIASVSMKLPENWFDDPDMWFAQAEANFRRMAMTVLATTYNYALLQLRHKARISVREMVRTAAALTDPHERVKSKLTAGYANSCQQLVLKLFDHQDLADCHPLS